MGGRGSTSQSNHQIPSGLTKAIKLNPRKNKELNGSKLSPFESKIKGNTFESAAGYNNKGKNVFATTSNHPHQVSFSASHISKLTSSSKLTHNHPSASGLSNVDIHTSTKLNLKSIRAVGKNPKTGRTEHYIMTRQGKSYKTSSPAAIDKAYSGAYKKRYTTVVKRTNNPHQAHREGVISANKAAAKVVGAKFRRRSIKQTW